MVEHKAQQNSTVNNAHTPYFLTENVETNNPNTSLINRVGCAQGDNADLLSEKAMTEENFNPL